MASFEKCWWLVGWVAVLVVEEVASRLQLYFGQTFWYFGPGLIFLDHIFRIFCILGPKGPTA